MQNKCNTSWTELDTNEHDLDLIKYFSNGVIKKKCLKLCKDGVPMR